MTPIEITFALIGIGFIVLVIYLVRVLSTANCLLNSVKKQIGDLGHEPRTLIHNLSHISKDLSYKIQMLDPLFNTLSNVGSIIEDKSERLASRVKTSYREEKKSTEPQHENKVSDLINWIVAGVNVYNKFRKGE
jgi:uncharacterized protein YoxC